VFYDVYFDAHSALLIAEMCVCVCALRAVGVAREVKGRGR